MGMLEEWSRDGKFHDLEDVLRAAAYDTECGDLVNAGLFLSILFTIDFILYKQIT